MTHEKKNKHEKAESNKKETMEQMIKSEPEYKTNAKTPINGLPKGRGGVGKKNYKGKNF